jgi:hypothetical protein
MPHSSESISGGVEEVALLLWLEEVSDIADGLSGFFRFFAAEDHA